MDRSKSRTDLLAAGKKRLQQFRQKKDGKGGSSRGKSKKSDKNIIPESDTDGRSSPSMSTTSSQVDGNVDTDNESNAVSTELLESQSSPNSLTLDNIDPSADSSPLAVTNTTDEQTELDSGRKSALAVQEGREVDSELSSQDQGKGAQDVGADVAEDVSLRTSDDQAKLDSERKSAIQVQEVQEVNSELSSRDQGKGAQDVGADVAEDVSIQTSDDQTELGSQIKPTIQVQEVREVNSELSSQDQGNGSQGVGAYVAEDISLQTSDDQTELGSQIKPTIQVQEVREVNSELSSQDQGNGSQGVGAYVAEDISLQTSDSQKDLESDRSGVEAQEVSKEDSELSSQDQGKDAQDVPAAVAEDVSLRTTDSLGPEGGATYDHESAPATVATAVGEPVPVTRDGDNREVSLLLSEDTPITSFLMQTREDKVTNLGAMQDADGLDMKKSSQNTDMEEPFRETEQLGSSVEVLSSTKDVIPEDLASDQGEGDDIATGGPSGKNLEGKILSGSSHEEMHLQSSHEQIAEQVHSGHGRGLQEAPSLQRIPVGSVAVDPNHELSMGDDVVNLARPVDASPSFGARSVDFMKVTEIIKDLNEDVLAEIIRGLNEDEFRFLLKSRGEVSDAKPLAASSTLPDSDFSEAFQRLKEELFLSTLMRSISDMQLGEYLELQQQSDSEHPQFIDEASELQASHIEVNEKNQHLIEELSICRAELQDVSQKCVELQNQFNTAKGEVETLSAKVVELQVSCAVSQEDSLNLATDLSDCRSLISCLQAEKKGMNDNLELLTAEKIRLADEKGFHLCESKRLSTELSNIKSSMEVTEAEKEVFDGSLGFVSLKTCLNEMEKVLVKLEQATNEFQFQSVGRSGEQVSSAAVSKLIQAFESKTHEDELEVEVRDSNEVHSSSESFIMFAKEETGNLRKLISEWKGHVQSADVLFVQFEELKQHCSNLEASNVELTVQCEAAKQLLDDFQEKKCHLEELCEALKQEDIQLKAKNNELYEKLGQFQSKVSELCTEICDVKQSSNEMSSIIGDQLENLQKDFTQRAMVLEQGWNTTFAEIFELVGKLNESVGETSSAVSSDAHDSLHVNHLLAVSVNAATKVIFDLRKKLEATSSEHETICTSLKEVNMKCEDLLGQNELAVGVLHEIYNDLRKLVLSVGGSMGEEKIDVQSEELPDLLNYNTYQIIMRCIGDIMTEKRELESINNGMKSEMVELKSKCLDLDSVDKLIEDLAGALNIEHSQIERNKTPLSCLDSLVSSLLQKTRDAEIQLHMTKEGYGSTEMELAELNDKIHYLDTLSFEKENEILVLKESLLQAKEALTAVHSELLERTHDLEHSEQKLSSVREKLSIAVAKGKGLVVQRDGLKQSLSETSYELERCMEELELKDARLHEVETKLKAYAEAGERMEAMESELSYIRNSSNSLRESFLLKDSMLQRIEEVLEELDLPEQFHSGDIIEKIDWLARSVASNSLPMNEWEQKDSAGGGSYSDLGYVARESWKDDSQPPPDSGDDSQNDDSQLQPDSGDDRIEWVGRALAEANHHVDSLQLKIEKYESYCGLLNSDLEGYQRTVSTLQTDLRSLTTEREHLSEKLESLMLECDRLSTEAGQAEYQNEVMHGEISSLKDTLENKELENEKLHNELATLKDILEKKDAIEEQVFAIDSKLRKLHDLVGDALPESGTENLVSGKTNIDSLEELLRKLIEDHASFRSKKDAIEEQIFTVDGKLRKLHDLVGDVLPKSETENLVSGSANIDSLEELLKKLVENQASLQSKKDAIEEQIFTIDGKLRKLHDLVGDALPESETENIVSGSANIDSLEELLRKLIENQASLQSKKDAIEEQIFTIDGKLRKLHDIVCDVLPEYEAENLVSGIANIDSFEELLRKLIENQASLQLKKDAVEEQISNIDSKLRKLHGLVGDVLPESETENLVSGSANIDSLEELLRKVVGNRANIQSNKLTHDSDHSQKDGATILEARSTDMHDKEEADIDRYKKELEEALSELEHAKEERDKTLEKQMFLSIEVGALSKKTEELQVLLNQEEQKSASVREKLNVAVRKGKSLVQHRDSLKQTIEEMSTEIKQLKSEISNRDETLAEHAQKLSHLSTYPNKLEALESEMIHLKNHLAESEHHLQEKEYSLNLILNKLGEIDIGGEGYINDPIKKLECIGKLCSDLHGTVASLEQESRKSKRAAELLLAELNEVQERNDAFQEELAKVDAELVDLRKERDSADSAKLEALSHLRKLSALHEEGKKSHFSEMTALTSSMNQLCTGFDEIQHLLGSTFSMDLESFQNLEAGLKSCMKGSDATNMSDSSVAKTHYGKSPWSSITKSSLSSDSRSDFDTAESFHLLGSQLQEVLVEIGSLKERIAIHSSLMLEQDKSLSELIASIEREMTSQRASCEAMKQKVTTQDVELVALRGSIDYLCEACISSLNEIENRKAELVGNKVEFSDPSSFGNGASEEHIKTLADRLLMAAKSFANIRTEFSDVNQNEMKATITNLQLELQEKDVQRERICSDLVKQIKDAEASANSYAQDLQSLRIQEHNLKKQVEVIEAERKILEERVNELQEKQRIAAELEDKSRSQTDLLAAKDQEIESLMHALDEEETQMEELTDKIVELEKVVQQKTQEVESLESSRGKVTKKLAVTVSKFDELHHLSASLLSEVERLQSQLQERDSEISFLRQEVTRCTNDVLLASQMSNKTASDEIFELLMWVDTMISQEGMHDILPDLKSNGQVHEYKEILQKKLMSVLAELENLKTDAENKDALLQEEKSKIETLNHKAETLEKSLHEKEMQLNLLEGVEENGREASTSSEILEVEPVVKEWRTGPFVTPQVRSLRKGNNDYVAIAVDEDPGSTSRIEDEEDDKVHGFKSLTSSKIVPRFTRPVTDLIDGLWVSCDRTLMRRPILRLGIIIYWAIVHALLAFFVV
ncbi:hypothetical protein PIB30_021691 [Stylosanthes scabra]|uniref:Uncharacterized protein n=1 Tax=Stylosanthes scabra TaxID=79078 RepID=A0ABU6Q8P7_9FABA|nr:hypothetical protein [Stylosanthes scabra]